MCHTGLNSLGISAASTPVLKNVQKNPHLGIFGEMGLNSREKANPMPFSPAWQEISGPWSTGGSCVLVAALGYLQHTAANLLHRDGPLMLHKHIARTPEEIHIPSKKPPFSFSSALLCLPLRTGFLTKIQSLRPLAVAVTVKTGRILVSNAVNIKIPPLLMRSVACCCLIYPDTR